PDADSPNDAEGAHRLTSPQGGQPPERGQGIATAALDRFAAFDLEALHEARRLDVPRRGRNTVERGPWRLLDLCNGRRAGYRVRRRAHRILRTQARVTRRKPNHTYEAEHPSSPVD